MTLQEAYDTHRERGFRDPEGALPKGVNWDDPLEVVAITAHALTWGEPPAVLADVRSPAGRERLDTAWRQMAPSRRRLHRARAGVVLLASEQIADA
jgi:hypothetical protein